MEIYEFNDWYCFLDEREKACEEILRTKVSANCSGKVIVLLKREINLIMERKEKMLDDLRRRYSDVNIVLALPPKEFDSFLDLLDKYPRLFAGYEFVFWQLASHLLNEENSNRQAFYAKILALLQKDNMIGFILQEVKENFCIVSFVLTNLKERTFDNVLLKEAYDSFIEKLRERAQLNDELKNKLCSLIY